MKKNERKLELQRQRRKNNPLKEKEYYENAGRERQKNHYYNGGGKEKIKLYVSLPETKEKIKKNYNIISKTLKYKLRMNNNKMKYKFGITLEDYQKIFDNQNGCCKICGKHNSEIKYKNKTRLCIDHNHITGKIRGLLCHNCNSVLGHAHDDINVLENAIKYLKEYQC